MVLAKYVCDISDLHFLFLKIGKIDVHLSIDIPGSTELVEPLEESYVWRQVRGAATEVLGMSSTAATVEKVCQSIFFILVY